MEIYQSALINLPLVLSFQMVCEEPGIITRLVHMVQSSTLIVLVSKLLYVGSIVNWVHIFYNVSYLTKKRQNFAVFASMEI